MTTQLAPLPQESHRRAWSLVHGIASLGLLAVFVLGSFVALATWWKGFDDVDSPQEPPQRLEAIGDLGYTVGLAGFLAVLVVCAAAATVAFFARSPRG